MEMWDTWKEDESPVVSRVRVDDGRLLIPLPRLDRDMALKVWRHRSGEPVMAGSEGSVARRKHMRSAK